MHIVRVATSPHAHARILSIDTSTAEAMDGVVAVFTHENVSTRRFSTGRHEFRTDDPDDSLIFDPVVRFIGQRVAAVVATTAAIAEAACRAIEVTYAPLAAVFDPSRPAPRRSAHPS